jgi:hypothetical protein
MITQPLQLSAESLEVLRHACSTSVAMGLAICRRRTVVSSAISFRLSAPLPSR